MRPPSYRTCAICSRPTVSPYSPYCARCRGHLYNRPENAKRRAALVAAYDRDLDAFRCGYCGAPLEEEDENDPFYLVFDHEVPRKESALVASSSLLNSMKAQLDPDELRKAVRELAAHHRGKPFDRSAVTFKWWTERAPSPMPGPGLHRGERARAEYSDCVVCGNKTVRYSIYCPRCRWYIYWHGSGHPAYARAPREAYDPATDGFVCQYTGVLLDREMGRPWSLNFDHVVPHDDRVFAVAAWWVNLMKTDLTVEEFWAVVGELDRCWREGGEFDRNIVAFEYWNRRSRRRFAGRHI